MIEQTTEGVAKKRLTINESVALRLNKTDGADLLVDGVDGLFGSRKQGGSRVGNSVATLLQVTPPFPLVAAQDVGKRPQMCMARTLVY
jgi:hypothetical protein